MKQNKVNCAVQIILFLAICHKAATVEEISRGIHMSPQCIETVLCLLQQADVLIMRDYENNTYQLRDYEVHMTLTGISEMMEKSIEKRDMRYRSKKHDYFRV